MAAKWATHGQKLPIMADNGQTMTEMTDTARKCAKVVPQICRNMPKMVENVDSSIKGSAHLSNLGTILFGEALPPEKKGARLVASCICQSKHLCVGSARRVRLHGCLVTGPAASGGMQFRGIIF